MPFAHEHSARVRNPEDFQQDTFRRTNISDGVDLISGKLYNEDTMTAQTYRFDAEKFTPEQAKQWCKDNDVKYISFEVAKESANMEGHIYVYGIISSFEEDNASNYGEVNMKDISNQLTNNKEADTLIVHISSQGGDVYNGYAIHDVLRASGKKIITQAEGLVASIATVIFLAGDDRRITDNSELMIHNPWGFTGGDSTEVQKYADQLKKEEDKLAEFYALKTGATKDEMVALMNDETYMNADDAINRHFATEKVTQIQAVAKLNYKQMTDVELTKKIEDGHDSVIQKIVALFKKQGIIKALILKTGDDKNLDFGEEIQEASQIVVGTPATVDGKPAEGDYIMPDGVTYVFEGGKVKEIKPAAPVEDKTAELAKENETLKAQLKESNDLLKAVQTEMISFKAQITSDIKGFKPEKPAEPQPDAIRKPFKTKE